MKNKSYTSTVRALHRYIGFFVIGLTLIYALSGILLVYKESDFLKSEQQVSKTIEPGLMADQLGKAMHQKVRVTEQEDGIMIFDTGYYNSETGELSYTAMTLPKYLDNMVKLHKASEKNPVHILSVVYGILLIFLAVSSFWMYALKSQYLKKGLMVSALGIIAAIAFIV